MKKNKKNKKPKILVERIDRALVWRSGMV